MYDKYNNVSFVSHLKGGTCRMQTIQEGEGDVVIEECKVVLYGFVLLRESRNGFV